LTIKFTRSIADYRELSAAVISCQSSVLSKSTPRRVNLWRLPAHRVKPAISHQPSAIR
jgi:hypothetical protein